ncbi:MAG TPA: hypothetical protein PKJ41_10160 [Bryobacteraceae bacterium]|nr:hypothetical protein [Bryobacteraceae bacterium]HPT25352.1 hypothetical protein [Bryobacteraceae bacterium]
MIAVLPVFAAWGAGWLWVLALRRPCGEPAAARWAMDLALGFALGVGASATLFFVLLAAGLGPAPAAIVSDMLALGGGLVFWWRRRNRLVEPADPPPAFKWAWLGWIGLAVSAAFLAGSMAQTQSTMPQGDWDAWAIWNMRAKFLASDGAWRGAVSPELSQRTHPEYPLLWSSATAKAWSWTGETGHPAAPAAAGALASLALITMLLAGIWTLRGAASGAMAALALITAVPFWQYAALQYADIPLSMFMVGALCLAVLAERQEWAPGLMALSGVLASLAAWTKDEGLVFCSALGITVLVMARKRALIWAMAAAPVALVVVVFKLTLAPGSAVWGAHRGDFGGRLGLILLTFWDEIIGLGHFPAHPLVVVAACVILLGVRRPLRPVWPLIPVAFLGASYIGAYLATTADLKWHLQSSAGRLLLQISPLVLFCLFLLLRTPVNGTPAAQQARKKR